jgi:uncharacterized lipoprotein YddW (UPF0748 family)
MKLKRFLIFAVALISIILFTSGNVSGAAGTTVIKRSNGTDLTYRNSSEKVLRLTEYTYPTQDFRGVWISSYVSDIASYSNETQYKNEVDAILDNMEAYGLNAMIFHIRIHNDALYDSDLNPRRNYWKNVNFDQFDPLTYIIEESHKRGIEFHAWLNPYRVLSSGLTTDLQTFASNYRASNPDFPNNPAGNAELLVQAGSGVYLNPGEPVVRKHIIDTIDEIINKYDVDAIHFDDYFYNNVPDTEDNKTYSKPGYNPKGLSKADWRRDQVNLLMAGIDELLDQHFDHTGKVVQLGISPTGIYLNSASGTAGQQHYSALYCDSVAWIQNEWIDYLLPQTYWGLEHATAPFANLTRYWSEVAKGYDVNMYLGHGIYMAPGSGWENINEVQNRFLNVEMYDRIDGNAFYKYSYFKNVSSAIDQIRLGLTLLKEDYWAKKVPGSVVRSYKDLVPVHEVSSINVQKVDGSKIKLSWDAVEDVRGYVVYRTQNGETLDVNNIDHLYNYIQTNEIVVENNVYEYYVSTVNKANVISTPKAVGSIIVGDVEGIIDAINQINVPTTLNQEDFIASIRNLYDQLSDTDKALVTNYNKLVQAETEIAKLQVLRTNLEQVINRASKHVVTDYVFPVQTDESQGIVTWEYKTPSDVHDLTTGKRLKEKLSYTPVTLIASITKDGLTYSEEVVVNFGITKENENPLFYRKDPSAMTKDEPGQYNETSHIGWSGKTLTVNNYVFFVASGNYLELTSSSIPTTRWHSCGTLYHNVTDGNISFALGDTAIRTDVNTYGYIIIDTNGNVRVSSVDTNPNSIITLQPNELLFASHYLDSLLTNPVFVPVTKVGVGTKVTFTDYDALRNDVDQQAQIVIDLIDALPAASEITLETDLGQFVNARNAYEGLSPEAKALVTNLGKLEEAEAKIEQLKAEALQQAKDAALDELKYFEDNLDLYSETNQQLILSLLTNARTAIQNATTVSEVNSVKNNYLGQLEDIITLEEELLIAHKNNAINYIENYLDLDKYSETIQSEINDIIADAKIAIQNATTITEVDNKRNHYISLLDELKDETLEKELTEAKQAALLNLKEFEDDLDLYSEANQQQINNILTSARTAIENATTKSEVNAKLASYISMLNNIKTLEEELEELNAQKEHAINQLNNYRNLSIYNEDRKAVVEGIIESGIDAINNATSKAEVTEALESAQAQIDDVPTIWDDAIEEVEDYVDLDLYSEENQAQIQTLINTTINNIENTTSPTTVKELVGSFKAAVDEIEPLYVEARENAKEELDNYVDLSKYSQLNQDKIKEIIENAKSEIDETTDLKEIEDIVKHAKAEINKLPKSISSNCQFGINIIPYLFGILGLFFIVIRRKR